MASRALNSDPIDQENKTENSQNPSEASLGAIFQTAYTSAQGSRPSTDLFEADYFEDAQLFADSDHEEDRSGVQALFVDTSSPRRSPMPGTSLAASRGQEQPFSFFPSPLMTSTSSL